MASTLAELRAMRTEDVVQEYDRQAGTTVPSLDLYRQELAQRDFEAHSQQMLHLTQAMERMTVDIHRWTHRLTWLTTLMAVVAILQLGTALWWKSPPECLSHRRYRWRFCGRVLNAGLLVSKAPQGGLPRAHTRRSRCRTRPGGLAS
jgi:hypothetical protein